MGISDERQKSIEIIKPNMKKYSTSLRKWKLKQEYLIFCPLITCVCVCVCACSVTYDSLQPHGLQPTRLLCPWNFPGKNTGAGCHFLLQGIFPTQESKLCLLCPLHWQADSLPLGSPLPKVKNYWQKYRKRLSSFIQRSTVCQTLY